jgi:hypothetical protein
MFFFDPSNCEVGRRYVHSKLIVKQGHVTSSHSTRSASLTKPQISQSSKALSFVEISKFPTLRGT